MKKPPGKLGRFHAWYNHQLTEASPAGEDEWATLGRLGENTSGERNYLIADIEGRGHYAGVNYYIHAPGPIGYGEGDDMFFIDGEAWPPSKTLFSHPYFGAARVNDGIGFLGRTHV